MVTVGKCRKAGEISAQYIHEGEWPLTALWILKNQVTGSKVSELKKETKIIYYTCMSLVLIRVVIH